MFGETKILNNVRVPKYKSKIERKIDALLTITDTYVHTYSISNNNLNTSSASLLLSASAASIVVVVFSVALKENVLKSVFGFACLCALRP